MDIETPPAAVAAAPPAPKAAPTDAHHDWIVSLGGPDPRSFASGGGPAAQGDSGGIFDSIANAAKAVKKKLGDAVEAVRDLVDPPPPLPPALPKARVDKAMGKLPPDDQKKVQKLLDDAGSEGERRYLTKALVANHSEAEIADFATKIAGKDDRWLNDNLRLVGDSSGKGIMQQWSHSCAPTTVEAIKGELDPIYAMQMRAANPNFETADDAKGDAKNPNMAADQKAMLVAGGGVAASRDNPNNTGKGMNFGKLLNQQSGVTGMSYDVQEIGKGVSIDDALDTMNAGVKAGMPVPITVGDATSPYAHAAVVVAVADGPPRTFTIHDPYDGRTDTVTEEQIKNDQVNVGGWHHVGVVFPPTLKP